MDEMDLTGSGVTGSGSGGALDLEPLYRSISDLPLPPITHQQSSDDQFDPPAILDTFTRAELDEHTFNYGNANAVPPMTVPMRDSSIGNFINNFDFQTFEHTNATNTHSETPASAVASAATSYFAQFSGLSSGGGGGGGTQYDAFSAYDVADQMSRKRHRHDPYDGFYDQTNNVTVATAIPVSGRSNTTVSDGAPIARPVLASSSRSVPSVQRAFSTSSDSDMSTQSIASPISPSAQSLSHQTSPTAPSPLSPKDSVNESGGGVDKDEHKKIKHQMTDRQRRAKIKESMDQLKALVPLEKDQKADQATIVQQSVELVKGLKDEVADLKKRLAEMELNQNRDKSVDADKNIPLKNYLVQQSYQSSSPFSAMMASLNGAGVCMWRVGLDGRILDVNLVFEMVTGWTSNDVVNKSPCSGPLYGSLSVMPKSFLRFFSQVSALVSPITTSATSSTSSSSSSSLPQHQQTQPSIFPTLASASSPLFSSITISSLPIVPQNELQSFFPFKCRTFSAATNDMSGGPQPHGQYLINHLANLPPSHVLKLLARMSTSYGDTLESIQTMCLVRTATGAPEYILCLTTPDGRRLVKPTKFLQPISPPNTLQQTQTAAQPTSITA